MTFNDLMDLTTVATALIAAQLVVMLVLTAVVWIKLTPPRATTQPRTPRAPRPVPQQAQPMQPMPVQTHSQFPGAPIIRT